MQTIQNKLFVVFLAALIFSIPAIGNVDSKETDPFIQIDETRPGYGKIHPAVQEETDEEGFVEVLVKLTGQVDTGLVARSALSSAAPRTREEQVTVRKAVVNKLRENAAGSQRDILKYLQGEQERGRVIEYKGYYIVNLVYVKAAPKVIDNLARRSEVGVILPNAVIKNQQPDILEEEREVGLLSTAQWNIARIKAHEAWEMGVDGSGVVVGIIDSGVYWEHEALKTRWRGYDPLDPDNPNGAYNWFDPVEGASLPADSQWHGTHVTGTVLGAGPKGNNLIGAAPGALWIAARTFNSENESTSNWLLDAGQFMLAPTNARGRNPRPELAPDIINNSWGGSEPGIDEWFRPMVQAWRDAQILPVFAAGNDDSGAEPASIVYPANYPESFAVGALTMQDTLANFSRRGPGPYDDSIKPEISAPGVSIRSSTPEGGYSSAMGTSMAAPHVSGTAALILSAEPDLNVEELEQRIMDTAVPLTDSSYPDSPNYGYGYGLVDAFAAATLNLELFHTVTFIDYDGTILGKDTVPHGEGATPPGDPEREGYTFDGWDTDFSSVTEDLTVQAAYSINSYTFTVETTDGGLTDPHGSFLLQYQESIRIEALPENGYNFVDWKAAGETVSTDIEFDFFMPAGDVVLTAYFTKAGINYGHVLGNDTITVADVILILRHIAGIAVLDEEQLTAADVDGDGLVTIQDAVLVLQHLLEKIELFPVEETS